MEEEGLKWRENLGFGGRWLEPSEKGEEENGDLLFHRPKQSLSLSLSFLLLEDNGTFFFSFFLQIPHLLIYLFIYDFFFFFFLEIQHLIYWLILT